MFKRSSQKSALFLACMAITLTLSGCNAPISEKAPVYPVPVGPAKWVELQGGKYQSEGFRTYYNENSIALFKSSLPTRTVQQVTQFDKKPNSSLTDIFITCNMSGSGPIIRHKRVRWYDQHYAQGNLLETEEHSGSGMVYPVQTELEWNFAIAVCGKDL